MATDLRHLQRLLNELQPAFLEVQQSIGPPGAPVLSVANYGPDHVNYTLPQISVDSGGDPVTLALSGMPDDYNIETMDFNSAPATPWTPTDYTTLQPVVANPAYLHSYTLAESRVTLTATDTVTGLASSVSFNFLGFGPDQTLGTGYPPRPQQLSEAAQLSNLVATNPSVPTIADLMAADPPPVPSIKPLQEAMVTWDHGMPLQSMPWMSAHPTPVGMDAILGAPHGRHGT